MTCIFYSNLSKKGRKMAKKAEEYITERINVEKLIPGGQALGQLENGKKIMLWGVLPGEIATKVRVTKEKSSYIEGIAEEFEQGSKERVDAKDSCYLATSPWQILDYGYELSQKKAILEEIFRQQKVELDTEIADVKTDGQEYFYRNKMEYALYYAFEDQKIHLAFHERGTFRKQMINDSSLERPEILARAKEIVNELNERHDEARKYQMILMRTDQDGEVSGGLVANYQPRPVFENLTDKILGYEYNYSPNGFFQINLPVYEMALTEIKKYVTTSHVLDLYAGVGTIGLSVARDRNLTLVESNGAAFKEMQRNCESTHKFLHKSKVRPILAKSEEALEYIEAHQTVIVDPPRAGLDAKVIERILEAQPEVVIYLSCNPATQARDVKFLTEKYRIEQITPFNFFPRTPHLENLIVLRRR